VCVFFFKFKLCVRLRNESAAPLFCSAQGFGLQTPLVNGQLKVIRYYPYFDQAFTLMKDLIVEMMREQHVDATADLVAAVRGLPGLEELYEAWGKGDFWVVSPCHSTVVPGRTMEGTRLTVQRKAQPDGFEVRPASIEAPPTPSPQLTPCVGLAVHDPDAGHALALGALRRGASAHVGATRGTCGGGRGFGEWLGGENVGGLHRRRSHHLLLLGELRAA